MSCILEYAFKSCWYGIEKFTRRKEENFVHLLFVTLCLWLMYILFDRLDTKWQCLTIKFNHLVWEVEILYYCGFCERIYLSTMAFYISSYLFSYLNMNRGECLWMKYIYTYWRTDMNHKKIYFYFFYSHNYNNYLILYPFTTEIRN